jgi:hypothetical protein
MHSLSILDGLVDPRDINWIRSFWRRGYTQSGRYEVINCEGLHKAENSIFTQVRTGKIGLADFLHRIGVPEATSPACACGYERETARHTTVFCPRYRATRNQLLIDGRLDFNYLRISDGETNLFGFSRGSHRIRTIMTSLLLRLLVSATYRYSPSNIFCVVVWVSDIRLQATSHGEGGRFQAHEVVDKEW